MTGHENEVRRRVVITGMGLVTPLGIGVQSAWDALLKGTSGIGPITSFDASAYPCHIAGEVQDFDPLAYVDKKDVKRIDRFAQFALASATMALDMAALTPTEAQSHRYGCLLGVGFGGMATLERNHETLLRAGPQRISPFFVPMLIANMAAGHVCMRFGLRGPNSCVTTACAAGTHAIGEAYKIIQRGDADVMLSGGCEAAITPLGLGGFCAMRALSTRNEAPQQASRPFDKARDGFVMGEGAGVLVLEELQQARQRGATIYAEVLGYGMSADAYHMTQPDPEARGVALCIQQALHDAALPPEAVEYINAHGTSTPYNDKFETLAVKKVFGEHAYRLAISSTKSMTGHLLGGAGGIEGVFTTLALHHGILPPTINWETPDEDCDLDYIPQVARALPVQVAMSTSLGFGGTNACIVFKRYTESA
ncbi:MAG: beta-ketoacyl-ACP synthase II [Candidatus Tectomicrobia bacterium]|uniref:3-oxoacyl-[acyl-carrier-protein] synthase 2 n=1 Tax=Tectimicrobiota bacterium TaxID=2528274 RepID=A0A937W6V4_UNCTE|nr:beta-ketoacyl-ACP synthase II [Candidatus Tectomicrobia bacterium]